MFQGLYASEAQRIIHFLKKDFLLANGALTLTKIEHKKYPYHIFPDLGDFLPFFLYFNEDKFIDTQIEIFKKILKNNILISEHKTLGFKNLAKSYEYSDLIYGLVDYYLFKKDDLSKKLLITNIDTAIKIFNFNKKFNSFYFPKFRFRLPIQDSRDGMMIELCLDLYKVFKEEQYLDIAQNIFSQLVAQKFYKKYGLFSTFYSENIFVKLLLFNKSSKKYFYSAEIMKNNTNTLFALLSLYNKTKKEDVLTHIDNIVKTIKNKATIENYGIIKTFLPNKKNDSAFLFSSFAFLDFLCDLYFSLKRNKDLEFAKQIANFWIAQQGKTGLFPLYHNSHESYLDGETDMTIALFKLAELTGDEQYSIAAEKCFAGIIKYHAPYDYILSVDIDTGKVIDKKQRTKFICLFLKLLILKIEYDKGKKIYHNQELFNILRDR